MDTDPGRSSLSGTALPYNEMGKLLRREIKKLFLD